MEALVLGLDISTSITGWTVLGDDGCVIDMGHVDFKDCTTIWEKVDKAHAAIEEICRKFSPKHFFIEESLQAFRPGLSSASTLLTLAKFNGLLSFHLRKCIGKDPRYISSGEARKKCGVKTVQKKKDPHGLGHKEQTFNQIVVGPLRGKTWPEKRGAVQTETYAQRVVTWALDECDSFVIAYAGWHMLNK